MSQGAPFAILVVEDNGALRRLITKVLSDSGFLVFGAASGPQGLALFRQHSSSIALAILDMVMPGMSGLDLAAELERQGANIQILYISGYGSSVAMESISQRSPERVLLKPFEPGELVDRVFRLLGPEAHQLGQVAGTGFAWDRLIEASDRIEPDAVEVLGYHDTGAAFAIAAAHSAALRAACLGYAFRRLTGAPTPFGLFVAKHDVTVARDLIERVGLGADVAQPA